MENYTKQYLETLNDMEKLDNDLNTILDNLAKEFFNLGQRYSNMSYEEVSEENGTSILTASYNIKDIFNIEY